MWRLIYYEWILIWNLQSIFLNPACAKSYFYHESYAIKGNSYLEFKVGYRMEIKCLVSRFYEEINILRVNSYLEFTTNIFVTPPIGCMTHRSGVNIFQFYRRRYLKINFQFTSNAMDFFYGEHLYYILEITINFIVDSNVRWKCIGSYTFIIRVMRYKWILIWNSS